MKNFKFEMTEEDVNNYLRSLSPREGWELREEIKYIHNSCALSGNSLGLLQVAEIIIKEREGKLNV